MLSSFSIVYLVAFGLSPSMVWLFIYLRKDAHPEPRRLLAKTFLLGLLLAPIAALLQWLFVYAASQFPTLAPYTPGVFFFLWAASIEEVVKFLSVKMAVLNNPEFDEPTDAMIYMITAALGFAAIENILVLLQALPNGAGYTVGVLSLRFVGATFLHVLASAIVGYFLALAWFYRRHSAKLIIIGILVATGVHFLFNFLLVKLSNNMTALLYSSALLLATAYIVNRLFMDTRSRDPEIT